MPRLVAAAFMADLVAFSIEKSRICKLGQINWLLHWPLYKEHTIERTSIDGDRQK